MSDFYRTGAGVGLQVAGALAHAHREGVLHRDIKPANLLLDAAGQVWVADFGLAKTDGDPLTHTGAIVGTIPYMAPERFRGWSDPRSDVYSLGLTLYELVALRPAFTGADQSQLIAQITQQDPPRLRKVDPQVPRDLETIITKAIDKEPGRRYQTADELAADLQRFLEDRPILARPAGTAERAWRWCRRNPVVAGLVAAVTVSLVAGIIGTTWGLVEARRQRDAAEANLGKAHQAVNDYLVQRDVAEANLRKAHQAVNDYFVLVSESTLLNQPALEPLRKQLLKAALGYYQDFAREHGDDPALQAEFAATYLRIGLITHDLGPEEDWLPALQKCVAVLEDLLRTNPDVSAFRSLRAGVFRINTASQMHAHRPVESLLMFEKARVLWEELVRRDPAAPGFRNDLAFIHLALGLLLPYSSAESVRHLQTACDLWRALSQSDPQGAHYRAALACTLSYTGIHLAAAGQVPQAVAAGREAVATATQLVADFPEVPGWQDLYSRIHEDLGLVLVHAGRLSEAEAAYRQMLAGQEALLRDYPAVARYRYMVLRAHKWLGEVLWATGRRAEAAEEFRQARALGDSLRPEDGMAQRFLAWFLATSPDAQSRDPSRALELATALVEQAPQVGLHWTALGAAHYARGDYRAAVQALENGSRPPSGRRSSPRLFLLAMAHWQLGEKDQARQCYAQAVANLERRELPPLGTRRLRTEAETLLGVSEPGP